MKKIRFLIYMLSISGMFLNLAYAQIRGHVDRITIDDGQAYLMGWACDIGENDSINVHVYVGGPNGTKKMLKGSTANRGSEYAVSQACDTLGTNHRFKIRLTKSDMENYGDQTIHIYGISKTRGRNLLLNGSGRLKIPMLLSKVTENKYESAKMTRLRDINIPENSIVFFDETLVNLRYLTINGTLSCPQSGSHELRAYSIAVSGDNARFLCGTAQRPFRGELDVRLQGNYREFMAMHGGSINIHSHANYLAKRVRLKKTAAVGANRIRVSSPVDWKVGSEILIATTSFNTRENEIHTIKSKSLDRKTLVLEKPTKYRHHGEIETHSSNSGQSWQIDQSAHVISLKRKIRIYTPLDDEQFKSGQKGGHVMIMNGGKAFISGVKFENLGQMGELGRYPFHWHEMGSVKGQYVKNSLVQNSQNRCYVIHGTTNALLDNNACFDHFGHGYFLEDGNEFDNTLTNNIGILSKRPPLGRELLFSDNRQNGGRASSPATFWLSHPSNTVNNNVAIASEGSGFWHSYMREVPCEHSACTEPSVSPITATTTAFHSNEAGSSPVGMTWDFAGNPNKPTGNVNNPKDFELSSAAYHVKTKFKNNIIYKSKLTGLYFRGQTHVFDNTILSDNLRSVWASNNVSLQNSIIIAKSQNHDPNDEMNPLNNNQVEGIALYDGPFDLNRVHFQNFSQNRETDHTGTKNITSSPMVLTGGSGKFTNIVREVSFSPGIPHWKIDLRTSGRPWPDNWVTSLRDSGKSIDTYANGDNKTLFRPIHPFNSDDDSCISADNSNNTLRCDYKYAQLHFVGIGNNLRRVTVDRIEVETDKKSTVDFHQGAGSILPRKVSLIANDKYNYTVRNQENTNGNFFKQLYLTETNAQGSPLITYKDFKGNCSADKLISNSLTKYNSRNDLENAKGLTTWRGGYYADKNAKTLLVRYPYSSFLPVYFNKAKTTPGVNTRGKIYSFKCSD